MKLHFTKMHALGNDFVLIDATPSGRHQSLAGSKKFPQLSRKLCSRRFGIGADQLLLLCKSRKADFRMRIFNADGGEVEMCGNGIRCLAQYIWNERKRKTKNNGLKNFPLSIETPAGIIHLQRSGKLITVDMGEPVLEARKVPVRTKQKKISLHHGELINHPLKVNAKHFRITCVSMGNPHTVIVVHNVNAVPVHSYGPLIENHKLFPKRTNVEFIEIINRTNIKMRVWERGAGETMACGTGASAVCVASAHLGLTNRKVTVHLTGGKLSIMWSVKNNHVYMTGPATKVFDGIIEI